MSQEFPGARWWRFDFHTHSPASYDYGKGPQQKSLKERTPRQWLLDFMEAEIDCVAITDHNTEGWIDALKSAYEALVADRPNGFRELFLFPGVEITVHGGVHLLGVFDPHRSGDAITALMGSFGMSSDEAAPDSRCTSKSFNDVVRLVTEAGGIPIPAHADRAHGVLTQFAGQTLQQILDSDDVIAAELWNPDSLKAGPPSHRGVRWAPVLGSDCHHPIGTSGQRFPGSHFTWVKMGRPSITGLKLALMDGTPLSILRSDVTGENPNRHADLVIHGVDVSNAQYAGRERPLCVRFSPWLTAIIGGRGTGKSTIVEMLRICARRDGEMPSELHDELARFAKIPDSRSDPGALTEDTSITTQLTRGDDRFRITWRFDGSGPAIERLANGTWTTSPGDVKSRFPIRIFSQKQILTLARRTDSLLGLIDESPEVGGTDLVSEMEELETRFLRLRSEIRELKSRFESRQRIKGEVEDISARIRVFERSDHRNVLVAYRRSERQKAVFESRKEEISQVLNRIRETAEYVNPTDIREDDFSDSNSVEMDALDLLKASANMQSDIANELRNLAENLESYRDRWNSELEKVGYKEYFKNVRNDYGDLKQQLATAGIDDVTEFSSLVQRRQSLELKLSEIDAFQSRVQSITKQANKALEDSRLLRLKQSEQRRAFLGKVLKENPYVRITLIPFGNIVTDQERAVQERAFRQVLRRENGLDRDILSPDHSEGLLVELYRNLPTNSTERTEEIARRLTEMKDSISSIHVGGPDTTRTKWFHNHVKSLSPEQIDRLLLWWPSDGLEIQYRRPQSSGWAPIDGGSPGQRSAALLAFLLSYGDDPIILDQPEDDLDNHLIYDLIVKQVRKNKRRRQVIVATHNANIVVNGDAEQVVAMDFQRGQCIVTQPGTGCLQESGVRDEICHVMEGGNEAFDARYRRLSGGQRSEG